MNWAGLNWMGVGWTDPNKMGPNRAAPDKTGPNGEGVNGMGSGASSAAAASGTRRGLATAPSFPSLASAMAAAPSRVQSSTQSPLKPQAPGSEFLSYESQVYPGSQTYPPASPRRAPLFPECSNPGCASGRLHLWRNHRTPVFEGGWVCSPSCMLDRLKAAVRRELDGQAAWAPEEHRHRIPLGLILLDHGWIDHAQLKQALAAKRGGDPRRIGLWLMEQCGLEEQRVTQALSLQWNCPVFSGEPEAALQALSPVPRVLLDALGAIPLRQTSMGVLYLAFEDRIDHSLNLSIERMTGRRVEAGLLSGSEFERHHERMLTGNFVRARLIEAASAEVLALALARIVEKAQPGDARLVRVHRFFWLRMWKEARNILADGDLWSVRGAEDVVCALAPPE
jgi:Type II secretion system (T2SS), protein E, N-terminal domain